MPTFFAILLLTHSGLIFSKLFSNLSACGCHRGFLDFTLCPEVVIGWPEPTIWVQWCIFGTESTSAVFYDNYCCHISWMAEILPKFNISPSSCILTQCIMNETLSNSDPIAFQGLPHSVVTNSAVFFTIWPVTDPVQGFHRRSCLLDHFQYELLGSPKSRSLGKYSHCGKWLFAFKLFVKLFIIVCLCFIYLIARVLYFSMTF